MMFGKLLFLFMICFAGGINNAYSNNKVIVTRRGKKISQAKLKQNVESLSYGKVMTKLTMWRKSIIEGDAVKKRPLGAMDYGVFAAHVNGWLKDSDLELKTKIDRMWFVKVKAMFLYMAKIKRYLEHAKMDGTIDAEQVTKKRADFIKAYDQFNNLIIHPKKITKAKWLKLNRAKKLRDKKKK